MRESERASERGRKDKDTRDREGGKKRKRRKKGRIRGLYISKEGTFLFSDVWLQKRRSVPSRGYC